MALNDPEFDFRKSLDTLKMENPTHRFRETNVELELDKDCKLKVKLWWVGACKT